MRLLLIFILIACEGIIPLHAELTTAQKQSLFLNAKKPVKKTTSSAHASCSKKSSSKSSSSHSHRHHTSSTSKSKKTNSIHSSSHSHSTSSKTAHRTQTAPSAISSNTSHDKIIPIDPSASKDLSVPITIEKSGVLPDQGLEPTPIPEASQSHGWWFFGGHTPSNYHYLTSSVRRAIDRAPVPAGAATAAGSRRARSTRRCRRGAVGGNCAAKVDAWTDQSPATPRADCADHAAR